MISRLENGLQIEKTNYSQIIEGYKQVFHDLQQKIETIWNWQQ